MSIRPLVLGACLVLVPGLARADLITVRPQGSTTVLSTITGAHDVAPSVVAGGFRVFAPVGDVIEFGDTDFAFIFGPCDSKEPCTATIDLAGRYSTVGGFMNYGISQVDSFIQALAADGTVLESYDLSLVAPISLAPDAINGGAFRGIARNTADIAYLRFSGAFMVMHDLTLSGRSTPTPEPTSVILLASGLVGIAGLRMKRYGGSRQVFPTQESGKPRG